MVQAVHILGIIFVMYRSCELWVYVANQYDPSKSLKDQKRARTASDYNSTAGLTFTNNFKLLLRNERGSTCLYLLFYFVISLPYFIDVNGYAGRLPLNVINICDGLRISTLICIFLIIMEQWIGLLKTYKTAKHKKTELFITTFLQRVLPFLLFLVSVVGALIEPLAVPSGAKWGVLNGSIRASRYGFYAA